MNPQLAAARHRIIGIVALSIACPFLAGLSWTLGVTLAHLVTR